MALPKDSVYKHHVNEALSYIVESGLIGKWFRDTLNDVGKASYDDGPFTSSEFISLQLDDLFGHFFLAGVLLLVSIVSIAVELIRGKLWQMLL